MEAYLTRRLPALVALLGLLLGISVAPAAATPGDDGPAERAPTDAGAPADTAAPLTLEDGVSAPIPPAVERPQDTRPPLATDEIETDSDSFVSFRFKDRNYGGEERLYVGEHPSFGAVRTFFWFDLDEIEEDRAITDAEVRMYVRDAGPPGDATRRIPIRRVTESYGEHSVTWNNMPDVDDEELSSESVGTNSRWIEWDITDEVKRWRLPSWNRGWELYHGLYLQGYETGNSYRELDSREGDREPVLRVEHQRDDKPPTAQMRPLKPYYNKTDEDPGTPGSVVINLDWRTDGTRDPEPRTGIDYFDLYARAHNTDWQLIGGGLKRYNATFRGQNGTHYQFVVYPVDRAGNVQPAKPPDTATTVDLEAPSATVDPLPEYVKGPFTISWKGQDRPQGPNVVNSGIARYYVDWNPNLEGWRQLADALPAEQTTLRIDNPVQGGTYQFRVAAADHANNGENPNVPAEAQVTVDGLPPIVSFRPVPGIDNETFTVRWSSIDPGESGTVSYDIQYRRGLGPWQTWVTDTTETALDFEGEFSNVYAFRGRARDRAGNVGQYPTQPQLVVGVIDRDILTSEVYMPFTPKRR